MLNRSILSSILMLGACSPSIDSGANKVPVVADNVDQLAENKESEPHYKDMDGTTYIYQSGLSKDDEDAGKAEGELSSYQYLGKRDNVDRIRMLNASDEEIGTAECSSPCKIIKLKILGAVADRIAFNPESIIGAVFDDVRHGHLKVTPEKKRSDDT